MARGRGSNVPIQPRRDFCVEWRERVFHVTKRGKESAGERVGVVVLRLVCEVVLVRCEVEEDVLREEGVELSEDGVEGACSRDMLGSWGREVVWSGMGRSFVLWSSEMFSSSVLSSSFCMYWSYRISTFSSEGGSRRSKLAFRLSKQ